MARKNSHHFLDQETASKKWWSSKNGDDKRLKFFLTTSDFEIYSEIVGGNSEWGNSSSNQDGLVLKSGKSTLSTKFGDFKGHSFFKLDLNVSFVYLIVCKISILSVVFSRSGDVVYFIFSLENSSSDLSFKSRCVSSPKFSDEIFSVKTIVTGTVRELLMAACCLVCLLKTKGSNLISSLW